MILSWTQGANAQLPLYQSKGYWQSYVAAFQAVVAADAFLDVTLLLANVADRTLGISSIIDRPLQRALG